MGIGRTSACVLFVSGLSVLTGPALAQDAPANADLQTSHPVRVIYPGPNGNAALPARATPSVPPAASPQAAASSAQPSASEAATAAKAERPSTAVSPVAAARAADSGADTTSEPADTALVDINSASPEELDRLGGRFGKAIVRGRPYQSIDDLVSRRILNRNTFGQIRDRITAR